MGISTKKSKSTSNTNQTTSANVTPTNLPGLDTALGGLVTKIGDTFANTDPSSLVPGANPLQTLAANAASRLGFSGGGGSNTLVGDAGADMLGGMPAKTGIAGTSPLEPGLAPAGGSDPYAAAMDQLRSLGASSFVPAQAGDISASIPKFMNPFLKDVKDTALADYDFGAGKAQGQANLDLGQDTTFGGSGGALYKRGLMDDILRGRGTLSAGLSSDAFNTAAGLAGQQAGLDTSTNLANLQGQQADLARRASAATSLADVGSAQQGNERSNIATQSGMGDILRQIQAAQAGAPISTLGLNASTLASLQPLLDLFKGSNATGSLAGTSVTKGKEGGASLGDWLSYFAANAAAAAKGAAGGG